jgi:chromosome segregation ATPase
MLEPIRAHNPRPLLPLLLASACACGCSAFGVATRSELERQEERWAARDVELSAQTASLHAELADIAQSVEKFRTNLDRRLAAMEAELGEMDTVRSELLDLSKRLEVARQELTILGGEMKRDVGKLREEVSFASVEAGKARELAVRTEKNGQRTEDSYLESLRVERRLLRGKLDEIETLLGEWNNWEAPPPPGAETLLEPRNESKH